MAKYGYIRVSSKDQNTDRQMDALMEHGLKKKYVFVDHMSGKDFERPEYQKMLGKLTEGDVLVVKSIDRIGRNYNETLEQWRYIIQKKRVDIEVLDMPLLNTAALQNGLTGVLISDLVLQVLAYVAEMERDFILQRQKEGIESAKKRGIRFGRTRIETPNNFTEACVLYENKELSIRSAAQKTGMSTSTFYRRYKEWKASDGGMENGDFDFYINKKGNVVVSFDPSIGYGSSSFIFTLKGGSEKTDKTISDALSYYGTWDNDQFMDKYTGTASLCRVGTH